MHLSKVLFSLDPNNLQLHCFSVLGTLYCCLFFCPLNQPCKTLQTVQLASYIIRESIFLYGGQFSHIVVDLPRKIVKLPITDP